MQPAPVLECRVTRYTPHWSNSWKRGTWLSFGPHTGARVVAQKKYERCFSRRYASRNPEGRIVRFHDLLLNHILWLVEHLRNHNAGSWRRTGMLKVLSWYRATFSGDEIDQKVEVYEELAMLGSCSKGWFWGRRRMSYPSDRRFPA